MNYLLETRRKFDKTVISIPIALIPEDEKRAGKWTFQ